MKDDPTHKWNYDKQGSTGDWNWPLCDAKSVTKVGESPIDIDTTFKNATVCAKDFCYYDWNDYGGSFIPHF